MTVYVAVIRHWDNNTAVTGVFATLAEAVAALERVAGEPCELIENGGKVWALNHKATEIGFCIEMTIGEQVPWHVAAGS